MIDAQTLILILAAGCVGAGSPGPATLAIAGSSMSAGRGHGLAIASGVTVGSLIWSVTAALGLSAVMQANAWLFEIMRYAAAAYLLLLAVKSAKSALSPAAASVAAVKNSTLTKAFAKGVLLHLTNPKPILFFGSLFAIGVPRTASTGDLMIVVAALGVQAFVIFHGYALLFSIPAVMRGYVSAKRWFEGAFAVAFGAAGIKIMTAKLN